MSLAPLLLAFPPSAPGLNTVITMRGCWERLIFTALPASPRRVIQTYSRAQAARGLLPGPQLPRG